MNRSRRRSVYRIRQFVFSLNIAKSANGCAHHKLCNKNAFLSPKLLGLLKRKLLESRMKMYEFLILMPFIALLLSIMRIVRMVSKAKAARLTAGRRRISE